MSGPVTKASHPRLAASSNASPISARLARGGTNTIRGRRPRAIDGDLHALHAKLRDAVRAAGVDVAAFGLELERDAAVGQRLEDFPGMGNTERLAAAECRIGNAGGNDVAGDAERLGARQL